MADDDFADLAGHERYLKTTLYGLTSGAPSCVVLMVGGNAGLIGMSKEHLAIALALGVPVIICITKVGVVPIYRSKEHPISYPYSDRYDATKQAGGDSETSYEDCKEPRVQVRTPYSRMTSPSFRD